MLKFGHAVSATSKSNSASCSANFLAVFPFLEIPEHHLPILHQAVNFVAHCLLREQVNALKLLGDLHVESNNRDPFLLFRYIILPSSFFKNVGPNVNKFPLNLFAPYYSRFPSSYCHRSQFYSHLLVKHVVIAVAVVAVVTSCSTCIHVYGTKM